MSQRRFAIPSAALSCVLALGCFSTEGTSTDLLGDGGGGSGGATSGPRTPRGAGGEDGGPEGDGADARCGEGPWTCVAVDPAGPYGTHTFSVPAAQNWVNTGLYLDAGQQATISETGAWSIGGTDTGMEIDHGPCVVGDLVARVGLHYKDPQLGCVAGRATFTAGRPGILFVGALAGNDLGETYETRHDASGAKTVTVTSDAATVPSVEAVDAGAFPFAAVASGWVEIRGKHVIVTLPVALAEKDAAVVAPALARIDTFYELHQSLRGAVPHHGQRIRFFPDIDTVPIGFMLAGNPVRMDPILVDGGFADRITQAGMDGVDVWGFAHELGHDFSFVNGLWWYQENSLESWPNVFTVHALEWLGLPQHSGVDECVNGAPVPYAAWDPWNGLCFLLQFRYAGGWDFYEQFFAELNTTEPGALPEGPAAWTFVRDRFSAIAGVDVTPMFDAWGVPHP